MHLLILALLVIAVSSILFAIIAKRVPKKLRIPVAVLILLAVILLVQSGLDWLASAT